MNISEPVPVFTLNQYADLTEHSRPQVRKWACDRLMEQTNEAAYPFLCKLIDDPEQELSIKIMNYLADQNVQEAAPIILERFQQAEKNLPTTTILASWCAQALGKLNYSLALPEFINYLHQHSEDIGLLGVCSALGDLHQPAAREALLELLERLESSKDGGIPYLGDVAVDALLKHRHPADIKVVLRQHQIWQNAGHKNPRTLSSLSQVTGKNEIFNRLNNVFLQEETNWDRSMQEEEALLGLSLTHNVGSELYQALIQALLQAHSSDIILIAYQAAEKILTKRYGSLDLLRGYDAWTQEQYRQTITPPFLFDQLSLAVLEELSNPHYRIHPSRLDAVTHKKQAVLALTSLLEIAGRQDYPTQLARAQSPTALLNLITSPRFDLPQEFEEKAIDYGFSTELKKQALLEAATALEPNYGQIRAIRLLGKLGYYPAIPFLLECLNNDWLELRKASIQALRQIGLPVLDYLEEAFDTINPETWVEIAEVLAGLPYETSAKIAYQAWKMPNTPKSDGLFMVQERVGSFQSINRLREIYQENPQLAGASLELLCDLHQFEFPGLEEIREANLQEEEDIATMQRQMWNEIKKKPEKNELEAQEKLEQYLSEDKPKKTVPIKTIKIDRNAPCPCGSGKKYKKCCGR